jgi:hypothetical protein
MYSLVIEIIGDFCCLFYGERMRQAFVFMFIGSFLSAAVSFAQTDLKNYSCKAQSGQYSGYSAFVQGTDAADAKTKAQAALKTDDVSCSVLPRKGGMSDLGGKKWAFQGLVSTNTYLEYNAGQVLHIQECGTGKMIQKFNAETVSENSLKLSEAGSEGSCNPFYVPGFKPGSVVSVNVMIYENQPAVLMLSDKRPGEDIVYTSLYKEVK